MSTPPVPRPVTATAGTDGTRARSTPAGPPPAAPRGPRGLLWTVLRLHRAALVLGALGGGTAVAVYVWLYSIGDDAREAAGSCGPAGTGLPPCLWFGGADAADVYRSDMASMAFCVAYLMLPLAAWAGAALTGRDLENGTAALAWTQSVSPTRWLAVKLAVPAVPITAGTALLVVLNRWAGRDGDPDLLGDWYAPDLYVSTGPTAVAYALAGLALGALAGVMTRRALPAAGLGCLAVLFLSLTLDVNRDRLWPAVDRSAFAGEVPPSTLRLGDGTYHPESHFWPLQFVESGLVLAVAAAAVAAAFVLLRRRTA